MILDREQLIEQIREDGAEDWAQVVAALEDGAYLKTLNIPNINTVEDAHDHAVTMADTHPDYQF